MNDLRWSKPDVGSCGVFLGRDMHTVSELA